MSLAAANFSLPVLRLHYYANAPAIAPYPFNLAPLPACVCGVAGWLAAAAFLHPIRRPLTPDLVVEADVSFAEIGAHREEFDVRAPDGVLLRGWKVRPANPNGAWCWCFTALRITAWAFWNRR